MKSLFALLVLSSALLFTGCFKTGKSFTEIEGVWIMDSGIEEYINKAGFEVKNTEKGYAILVGEIRDGRFVQQADPVLLTQKDDVIIAEIKGGSTLKLTQDKEGIVLIGFTGENKGTDFHFKRLSK